MKKWIALISLIVSATVYASEELHNFTMNDGTAFSGVVISCDSQLDTVELLAADGTTVSASWSEFNEEDCAYLKQKETEDLFMSPLRFVIIPSHTVDQQWLGEELGEQDGEGVSQASGISEHRYYLTLYNLGSTALENMNLNYQIIYRQSGSVSDGVYFPEQASSFTTEDGEISLSKVADGVIHVTRLGAREWKVYSTSPAVIVEDEIGSSSSLMKITINMETADGSTLTRENELPTFNSTVSHAG